MLVPNGLSKSPRNFHWILLVAFTLYHFFRFFFLFHVGDYMYEVTHSLTVCFSVLCFFLLQHFFCSPIIWQSYILRDCLCAPQSSRIFSIENYFSRNIVYSLLTAAVKEILKEEKKNKKIEISTDFNLPSVHLLFRWLFFHASLHERIVACFTIFIRWTLPLGYFLGECKQCQIQFKTMKLCMRNYQKS